MFYGTPMGAHYANQEPVGSYKRDAGTRSYKTNKTKRCQAPALRSPLRAPFPGEFEKTREFAKPPITLPQSYIHPSKIIHQQFLCYLRCLLFQFLFLNKRARRAQRKYLASSSETWRVRQNPEVSRRRQLSTLEENIKTAKIAKLAKKGKEVSGRRAAILGALGALGGSIASAPGIICHLKFVIVPTSP
jgi:hypothetical protein